MKKILVLLLALAMLIPMGLVAGAAEAETAIKPFTALGWSDINEDKFPNLDGLPTVNIVAKGDNLTLSYGGTTSMKKMAEKMKAELESRPEGLRHIHMWGPARAMLLNEDVIYAEDGTAKLKALFTEFINECKAIDAPVEGIIIDVEHIHMGAYYIYRDVYSVDKEIYNKIVNNPRYETDVRPLLVEYGFPFYPNVTEYTPEIYSISNDMTGQYPTAQAIWGTIMDNRIAMYMNEIFYEPLMATYPDATFSDYQTADQAAWMRMSSDSGNASWTGGNTIKIGNVSNHNTYSTRPSDLFFKDGKGEAIYKNPASYYEAVYERTPFHMFLYDANFFKQIYASTDNKRISAWIAEYDYNAKDTGSVSNTPYYAETILHLGLLNPEPFLIYMYLPAFDSQADYDYRCQVISQILEELTRVVGAADRKPIETPANWNSDFVLSGMTAGGKNIWRITPNTGMVSLEEFKVEGEDLTFRINGQTVTFPGGKIIADGKIDEVGTCGYWVETAKDVVPTVKTDADRFDKNPAYVENFDSYEANSEFNIVTAKEQSTWTVKLDGKNKPTIVENNGSNALSISGDTTLTQTKIMQNITAGDSYAKLQKWDVTVTLPEGVDGEIVLLNTNGKKGDAKDGGFKIADGKIYYNENGEYKELTAAKGGTYTFRRVVNFVNTEAFTCSYYVYDASGAEVAAAKDVAMVTFKIPVTSIAFSTKDVTGKVLLDDYKLSASGAVADLSLYKASSGALIEDITQANTTSTAYRLSWMNATDKESKATIKYDLYEGDKLVSEGTVLKEINRLPGCDGVETGVVEIKEGQSVKIYVEAEGISAVTPNGGTNNDPGKDPDEPNDSTPVGGGMDLTMLIVVIASVVVAVVMVVVAVIVVKKPKKAVPAAPADDAIAEEAIPEKKTENTEEKKQE